jgi:hypothetical protein
MKKGLLFLPLIILVINCFSQSIIITNNSIGLAKIGMTTAVLLKIYPKCEKVGEVEESEIGGIQYIIKEPKSKTILFIAFSFDGKTITNIYTNNPVCHTKNGTRVGMTLAKAIPGTDGIGLANASIDIDAPEYIDLVLHSLNEPEIYLDFKVTDQMRKLYRANHNVFDLDFIPLSSKIEYIAVVQKQESNTKKSK